MLAARPGFFSGVKGKAKRALTDIELGNLLNVCDSLEFRVISPYLWSLVVVLAYTGLRPSEVKRLRWDEVDFDRRGIRVSESKTKAGIRFIPMHPLVFDALRRQRLEVKGDWVFPSPKNAGEHIKDFGKAFEKAAKKSGLRGVSPYYLRHTFMTWLDNAEQRRAVLLSLRGHTRESHGDPYLHPDWQDKVAAIERLPLPAKVPTQSESGVREGEAEGGKVQASEELEMVGPWGLEPQTSTVSR
jgi:integrase